MSLFDTLVDQALASHATLSVLRPVVEKEILHHDIIREMNQADLLRHLTFIGGTCLRACYGSSRLSEDLDFTGGADFRQADLDALKTLLETRLHKKYGLPITVTEPRAEKRGRVRTWKLQVNTRPERADLTGQRIHLDICAIPSYRVVPQTLRNHYGISLGTDNLIINAQSREEIFTDKLLAFAMRPGRIKNRDLWDIVWLTQTGIDPAYDLLAAKLEDHGVTKANFQERSAARLNQLANHADAKTAFAFEMRRFLPPQTARQTMEQDGFWPYLTHTVTECMQHAAIQLDNPARKSTQPDFPM